MKRSPKTAVVAASSTGSARETKPSRRAWRLVALLAAFLVLGVGGLTVWRGRLLVQRGVTSLPGIPPLADRPAILAESLAKAEAKAKATDTRSEGIRELGCLYHANNFYREADACWKILRTEQPDEARWCYYLADLRRAASDYSAMADLLQQTLRLAPDYAPARLTLANLQFKSGEIEEAGRNYQRRLDALPRDPYARLGLVRIALQQGQENVAKTQLERLLADAPNFSSGHNLYAEILAAAGDVAGAGQHRWLGRETLRYREAADPWLDELQAWCYDYDRLCTLGTAEMLTENSDQARALLQRAIQLRPAESQAYELLGVLFLKRNDAVGAVNLFEQALPRLNGKNSAVFFASFSQALRLANRPAEAVKIARVGLARVGRTPELLDALGLALANIGQHEEAVEAWQSALAQNPGDAGENYNLAMSLLALRRLDDALEALDRSLTLQPTYLPTLLLRGQIELEAGHRELAEKYLRPAFASHPEDPQARRLLADWHLQMGAAAEARNDPDGAERNYRDGLTVDETHADLTLALGVFYLAHDRYSKAIGPLASFHQLHPENASGFLFLGQAYAAVGQHAKAREILQLGIQQSEQSGDVVTADRCRTLLQQL